jgi:hypothetical protein
MNLKSMIPFLEEEELKELCDKIAASPEGEYQGVRMKNLLPFLEEEEVDRTMLVSFQNNQSIEDFLPFASENGIHQVVVAFLGGTPLKNPKRLFVFLDESDAALVANKLASSEEAASGLHWNDLLPFMSDSGIDALFYQALQEEKPTIKTLLPFVSENALHQAVEMYLKGELKESAMDAIYPYLEDEDLHALFKAALK